MFHPLFFARGTLLLNEDRCFLALMHCHLQIDSLICEPCIVETINWTIVGFLSTKFLKLDLTSVFILACECGLVFLSSTS